MHACGPAKELSVSDANAANVVKAQRCFLIMRKIGNVGWGAKPKRFGGKRTGCKEDLTLVVVRVAARAEGKIYRDRSSGKNLRGNPSQVNFLQLQNQRAWPRNAP